MARKQKRTDNSRLEDKMIIRREVIDGLGKSEINVVELYAGRSVMWGKLAEEYSGRVKINLLSIEKERGKNLRALCGDNMKFIANLDLSRYDIVDVDAYGIPAQQLAAIRQQGYAGWVVVTAIQSQFGMLPPEVYLAGGVTQAMLKKVKMVFNRRGLELWKNFLYSLGCRRLRGFFEGRKYYFYTRFEA